MQNHVHIIVYSDVLYQPLDKNASYEEVSRYLLYFVQRQKKPAGTLSRHVQYISIAEKNY